MAGCNGAGKALTAFGLPAYREFANAAGLAVTQRNHRTNRAMHILTLHLPDSLDMTAQEVTALLVARLYEQGKLSLGQAAELVGLSKPAFAEALGHQGVSVFNYPPEDIARDAATA